MNSMTAKAVFIDSPDAKRYKFNLEHPFNPIRLTLAPASAGNRRRLERDRVLEAAPASDDVLHLVHRPDYIEAVQHLSEAQPALEASGRADQYGLSTEDTPYFPGMHEAAAAIAGGSILAADVVMRGQAKHAYHMAGGLHHAFPDRGSGFCVYNDVAIAIAHIVSNTAPACSISTRTSSWGWRSVDVLCRSRGVHVFHS